MATLEKKKFWNAVLAAFMAVALAACGGGGGSSAPPDSDGDGVIDSQDAFPNDPTETVDSDGDGVGNNADDFPNDASETTDTDGDGVGDNSDNCVNDANADQADSDANGEGDVCDPIPTSYEALGYFGEEGASGVSYTGQTARQVLQLDLVSAMQGLSERAGEGDAIVSELSFYVTGDGADSTDHGFATMLGLPVIPGPTYGDISSGKNLDGKIAGGNGEGGGETGRLINDEFFGWNQGLDADPLPIELVNQWIAELASNASDGTSPQINTVDGAVSVPNVTISATGLDYRQLIQKFLAVAVNFSQGTNDYMQTDFANSLGQEGTKAYSAGAHDFDEAFGYYGAARNMNDYTDDEAAKKGGREEFQGANDANNDGSIDLRSEYVFGHSQNCAKRDRLKDANGEAYYDFSKTAMDAFVLSRKILQNAEFAQELTADEQAVLDEQLAIAATTWEQCIAATAVHYINDVLGDINDMEAPNFLDLGNFTDLAKHWAEMKGFALGLQFSPYSPFRTGAVDGIDVDDLKAVLSLMGDAPVLADGSQGGVAASGTAQEALDAYAADLLQARDILEAAYGFNSDAVEVW